MMLSGVNVNRGKICAFKICMQRFNAESVHSKYMYTCVRCIISFSIHCTWLNGPRHEKKNCDM